MCLRLDLYDRHDKSLQQCFARAMQLAGVNPSCMCCPQDALGSSQTHQDDFHTTLDQEYGIYNHKKPKRWWDFLQHQGMQQQYNSKRILQQTGICSQTVAAASDEQAHSAAEQPTGSNDQQQRFDISAAADAAADDAASAAHLNKFAAYNLAMHTCKAAVYRATPVLFVLQVAGCLLQHI